MKGRIKEEDRTKPLYMISIVSSMLHVHPQTLRLYEREGLVCPKRVGRQRLYSEVDVERLNMILSLTRELGVNKAGVEIVLRMKKRLECLQEEIEHMMALMDEDIRGDFERKIRGIFYEEDT